MNTNILSILKTAEQNENALANITDDASGTNGQRVCKNKQIHAMVDQVDFTDAMVNRQSQGFRSPPLT